MLVAFQHRREAMALSERLPIEDIPYYRVRTPLQLAIQILKRHRDIYFADSVEIKPISVILTTLAAHAYDNETRLAAALISIVDRMTDFIETRKGIKWIANPSHPTENFADRWVEDPARQDAFYSWHAVVSADIALLLELNTQSDIDDFIDGRFGSAIARSIKENRNSSKQGRLRLFEQFSPRHRKSPPWAFNECGTVQIADVVATRNGFQTRRYRDGSAPLMKGTSLRFSANTDVPRPYRVYWQVVNWGEEAKRRGDLRGGFDDGGVSRGNLSTQETAQYTGTHTIECFIVKDDYLVARSGRIQVNIR